MSETRKVNCKRCYGHGYYSGTYGRVACEDCNTRGHFFLEMEKVKNRWVAIGDNYESEVYRKQKINKP